MPPAVDQLPDLNSLHDLPPDRIEKFQRLGHTVVRGLCNREELDAYLPAIAEGVESYRQEKLKLEDRDTYHKAFIQVANLWRRSEAVKRFVIAQRFAKVAADLLQCDGVRIYHDQALFKEPGGGHTPWHQDQFYWPIDTRKTVTMWMPFVQAPIERGALTFASALQEKGALVHLPISDASKEWFTRYMIEHDVDLQTYELDPGDATFHMGFTPHKAPGNATAEMRPVMTIIYMDAEARVSEPVNDAQPLDLEAWFPGLKPGDLAASPINPCVWHKDPSRIDAV